MNPIGAIIGPRRAGDGIPLGRLNNGLLFFFACKRACWASSISASERWPLWAFYFVKDREGSRDLALVATPPVVPSGAHLSTAWEDFVFGCVLGPLFWVVGWLVLEPF